MTDGSLDRRLAGIRLLTFDVDGVFTDGRFYLSDDGVETKAFDTQDGYGVKRVLEAGVHVAVISGRVSPAAERRMRELGVEHLYFGCGDKVGAFEEIRRKLGVSAEACACVGDDLPDAGLLERAGLAIAVANAHADLKALSDMTTSRPGGRGAVREICDLVVAARRAAEGGNR